MIERAVNSAISSLSNVCSSLLPVTMMESFSTRMAGVSGVNIFCNGFDLIILIAEFHPRYIPQEQSAFRDYPYIQSGIGCAERHNVLGLGKDDGINTQNKRLEQNCQLNLYHRAFLTVSGHDSHLWDDVCRVHDHIDCCSSRIPATFCANSSAIMFRGHSSPVMS